MDRQRRDDWSGDAWGSSWECWSRGDDGREAHAHAWDWDAAKAYVAWAPSPSPDYGQPTSTSVRNDPVIAGL